jgi:hypothetical protein
MLCTIQQGKEGKCLFDTAVLGECATYPYGYIVNGQDKYIKAKKSPFHRLYFSNNKFSYL